MATVSGQIKVNTSFNQPLLGLPGNGSQTIAIQQSINCNLQASGTAADQVDLKHSKRYNFVASTPQTIDLQAAVDDFGTVDFARVRTITIKHLGSTDNAPLIVGGGGAGEWDGFLSSGGTLKVFPASTINDSGFVLTAPNTTGIPVSGGSHLLKLDPGAAAFSADIEITGCSA